MKLHPLVVQQDLLDLEIYPVNSEQRVEGKVYASFQPTSQAAKIKYSPSRLGGEDYPIVVMKLEVNESSENRSRRQLFPTPVTGAQVDYGVVHTKRVGDLGAFALKVRNACRSLSQEYLTDNEWRIGAQVRVSSLPLSPIKRSFMR